MICGTFVCLLSAVVGFSVAARGNAAVPVAASAATCTWEQKQTYVAALQKYQERMAAERAAYFKRHKNPAQRAAFVKRQKKKLAALRAAAACEVTPMPASSDQSCSFMPSRNADEIRSEPSGFPTLNEGPLNPAAYLTSRGHVRGLMLMLAFPDAAAPGGAVADVAQTYAPDSAYFDEVSNSRFAVTVDSVPSWVQMPHPTSEYAHQADFGQQFLRDAITAADPMVDFSRYQFVIAVPTPRWIGVNNLGWARLPGHGIQTSEGEIRHGAMLTSDVGRYGPGAHRAANHEFIHSMGLPDIYGGDHSTGSWDPLSALPGGPPPGTHLLGWHKWLFGWLDPQQLTCVSAPGSVEETLTANAARGGKKLVVVPTGPSTAFIVEARLKVGYDQAICEEGVLVYDIDSQIDNAAEKSGRGPLSIKGPRRCVAGGAGALHPGEVYEDGAVKVEVLGRDTSSFRVRVTKK